MTDCPTCEYHKQRAKIWRDEAYRLAGHPLPRKKTSMTQDEMIELARQAGFAEPERIISTDTVRCVPDLAYFAELVAAKEREQSEPVAFKIYKPTPLRHATPNVQDAELPWVYDQDPSSGNVASMWVTPVQALRSKT